MNSQIRVVYSLWFIIAHQNSLRIVISINIFMLKIKRKALITQLAQSKVDQLNSQKKSNIAKWLEQQLSSFAYSLTDQNADFYVNNVLRQQNNIITVEMYVKPKRGIFQHIQFRPKIYFSSVDLVKRPKIYNDRRILHPNINIQTLEIIFPQLVLEWNPTKKLQLLMKSLKYVLIEPNIAFVPNTEVNRKAGVWYHFKRNQYRQFIFENMPISFQLVFNKDQKEKLQKSEKIQLEAQNSTFPANTESQWFDVRSLYPSKLFNPKVNESQLPNSFNINKKSFSDKEWKDQEEIKILAKQMKKVHVFSDNENEPQMEMES